MIAKLSLFTAILALAFLAIFGCSGVFSGSGDDMPCITCLDSYYGPYTDKGNSIASYRTVTIGSQKWMAENLDYNVSGSKCYSNNNANCVKYGRLYDWATAMALPSSCNSADCSGQVSVKHQGICPSGWHIPSDAEWSTLINYVESDKGCSSCAGKHLKSVSGWNSYSGIVNLDSYGFSALPGGYGISGGIFRDAGGSGYWWSASEYNSNYAYDRDPDYYDEGAYWYYNDKGGLFSVRCLQD
ncbi:MAG: hypothetical protein LBH25_11535 [Fibromonadaceae bacterium]|jgi:uncharacterized protein (TIGR02145 family)|nr:hypothetical protein [Fibromonadaceae bacterium]